MRTANVRKNEQRPPILESLEALDSTVDIHTLPRYRQALLEVLGIIKQAKKDKQTEIRFGAMARQMTRTDDLADVLRELSGQGVVAWNPSAPAPSVITI